MRKNIPLPTKFSYFPLIFLAIPFCGWSQTAPRSRILAPISDRVTVRLRGNVHPLARPEYDAGPVAPDRMLSHIKLVLNRDPAQQAALDALTTSQQNPSSALFHQWLTPDQIGARYGVSQQDLNEVSNWLRTQGFTIEDVAPGGWVIRFSGTAAQVQTALHTELHVFNVNGETHFANVGDPQIPQALAPVVAGVFPLHDFRKRPNLTPVTRPNLKLGTSYVMQAADFATIYDLTPLYSSGIDGTNQTIAITSQCPIDPSYVQTFRTSSGLATNNTIVQAIGPTTCASAGDAGESYFDAEWAGAVAKGATILVVADDNIDDSALYIVQHNVAPVISTSYGSCEAVNGTAENVYWNLLWQQAAAQGMTSFVASGDAGAAGCDDQNSETKATHPAGVNGLCTSPYSICVGGTEFNDTATPLQYWSPKGSALGYIPEVAWNESGTVAGGSGLWSSGGGYSTIYPTPSWQSGNTGGTRGVPDVAVSAASHDGYYGITDQCNLCIAAGTSLASPSFAGIMALVVQKTGQRQGNANPALYSLAATSGIFHDVTTGNNNVPGLTGFSAGPGWDPVTGLGSVDANALVAHWPAASVTPPPLSGGSITFDVVTKGAPPPRSGCTRPAPASSFQSSDGAVYLYFEANVTTSDVISDEWIAPDGSVFQNGPYYFPLANKAGLYCFNSDSLDLSLLTNAQSGSWKVNIYDNGTQLASISFTVSIQAPPPPVIPQSGWWWDPNLSGEGFFLEYGGSSGVGVFMAGFFSDASGNPTWLASTGAMNGATYASTWLNATGGQMLLGPYHKPNIVTSSPVSILFSDPSHGVLTRPDGTQVNIQRYGFSAGAVAPPEAGTAQVGWWWGGTALTGTGYAVEFQGSNVFIAAYVYDASGNPIWYLATGTLTSPTQYSGTWDSYIGGPQLSSPEGTYPSHKSGSLTPMTLNFTDATHGTMTMGTVSIPLVRYQQF